MQPPDNFAMMHAGVFRGSFPSKRSLPFMRGLNLRSILYLCPEEPPEYYVQFMREHDIAFLHHGLTGNKEPFVEMSDSLVADAVAELVLARHQPLYVHCDKGKHRTGCVIGCYRRMQVRAPSKRAATCRRALPLPLSLPLPPPLLVTAGQPLTLHPQNWSITSIFEEYTRYAGKKGRTFDLQFIELFDTTLVTAAVRKKQEALRAAEAAEAVGSAVEEIVGRVLRPAV